MHMIARAVRDMRLFMNGATSVFEYVYIILCLPKIVKCCSAIISIKSNICGVFLNTHTELIENRLIVSLSDLQNKITAADRPAVSQENLLCPSCFFREFML